jgi:hypothetical protein
MVTLGKRDSEKKPPCASFRKLKPEYVRNGHDDVLVFTQAMHLPRDVAAYGREAPNCFNERRYLATIILSTAAIEIILNKDSRMRVAGRGWQNLNIKQLRDGDKNGLPVAALLGPGESLRGRSVEFIDLRNRIAHGNLQGMIGFEHTGTPDYSREAREAALSHMKKADAFVMEWYNTAPDVQERKILNQRWPGMRLEGRR